MQSIKCVAVGDGLVGKTSLLIYYTSGAFPKDYVPTVFDNFCANIAVNDKIYCLELWDTAGQEELQRLRPLSYQYTDVFLLCFSVDSPSSFINITNKWIPEVRHFCKDAIYILVGTKIDLRNDPNVIKQLAQKNSTLVTFEQGEEKRRQINAYKYIECSARYGLNVKEIFNCAILSVLENFEKKRKRRKKKGYV